MANTTNLNLQKIQDTDYAGNFPTIYNDNLDLIDEAISDVTSDVSTLSGKVTTNTSNISTMQTSKQDKLIAGTGVTIASDGKTISASGKEYTAGSGITISSSGVISTTIPIGTYTTPLTASMQTDVELTTYTSSITMYPSLETTKIGNTISSSVSGTSSTASNSLVFKSTQTTVNAYINLIPLLGDIDADQCTITCLFISSTNMYNSSTSAVGLIYSQPITGTIVNGRFTGTFVTKTETSTGAIWQTYYYGIPVISSSGTQHVIAISSIAIN